jgi:hypothetical protein
MSTDKRDESVLDEYLEGGSKLSRLYQGDATEQPPAELDARIRAEAKRAVAPPAHVGHGPFSRHWMVPTSLAAVVVLSVSVVLLIPDPVLESDMAGRMPAPDAAVSTPPPASVSGGYAQAPPARELDLGATSEQLASEPASPEDIARSTRKERAAGGKRDDGSLASDVATVAPSEAKKSVRQQANAPAAKAPSPSVTAGSAAPSSAPRAADEVMADRLAESEPAPTPSPARKRSARAADAKPEEERSAYALPPPAGEVAPGGALLRRAKTKSDPDPAPPREVQADPERWEVFIEKLLEDDDTEGARSNLRAFRLRYPDQRLDGELARLAESMDAEEPGTTR